MLRRQIASILCLLLAFVPVAQAWTPFGGGYKQQVKAENIETSTTNFGNNLSSADTDVQKALDTLDNMVAGGGGAPTDATYITQTANGSLSAEQALSSLSTGLVKNTTGTGVLSIASAGTDYVIPAGNVATATALAANGTNCSSGSAPLGVDASGAAESCTDYEEDLSNSAGLAAAISDETGTGVVVFGTGGVITLGANSTVPNGAAPTSDAAGEVAVDTTDDQFQYYGAAKRVLPYTYERCFTVQSPTATDDNVPIFSPVDAITVTGVYCRAQGGTSVGITISDGTNAFEEVVCDSDGQADDGSITNATFTANERMEFDTGTVTGTVDWNNVCIRYSVDSQ